MNQEKSLKQTAILVIHGIGEQFPFQTLDSFTSAFWKYMEETKNGIQYRGSYHIKARQDWTQSFISLSAQTEHGDEKSSVDIYEYYWAYKPQGVVKVKDIIDWLIYTSKGAGKFYEQHPEIVKKYKQKNIPAFKKDKFKEYGYLNILGWYMEIFSWLGSILDVFGLVVPVNIIKVFTPIIKWLEKKAIDYIGDIVIYTTNDMKSKFFKVRTEILYGAVEEIKQLLEDEKYERIIIAGHSLGSVIAYDALNRINLGMNTGKISRSLSKKIIGLVTFGSPLDKIAFFFSEQTKDNESLRRQIIAQYHGFRKLPYILKEKEKKLDQTIELLLNKVQWINFYDVKDKVSGNLDFYEVDENVDLEMESTVAEAHMNYWNNKKLFKKIIQQYF